MSRFKVIKASAGSGKTFTLTAEYLKLLFKNPNKYKHILAVTFTNKATAEMKTRILGELFKMASGIPSPYIKILSSENNLSEREVQQQSAVILEKIMHNYSRFSVLTIDSFFQRIIRSFAKEAGLPFNFEIELNTGDVLEEATDVMLEKLYDDKLLLNWLTGYAEKRIEDGKTWDFKKEIYKLGEELFTEQFKSFSPEFQKKIANREWMEGFRKKLFASKVEFEKQLKAWGQAAHILMQQYDVLPDDFKYGMQGGPGTFFLKLLKGEVPGLGKRIQDCLASEEAWLGSKKNKHDNISQAYHAGLGNIMDEASRFINDKQQHYNTCSLVQDNFYTLGVLADLAHAIEEYAGDNNLFLQANASAFLKLIIADNDAPFIYEKTGQTYNHYMIDEFQDTSGIQWFNFKPLLKNSLAEGNDCLVVGDVKQSIYRWRNSDWKIMANQLHSEFASQGFSQFNLETNWRSCFQVVAFNNTLFHVASSILQDVYNLSLNDLNSNDNRNLIKDAYADCLQLSRIAGKKEDGYIRVKFFEPTAKLNEAALEVLPKTVEEILSKGYSQKDIAFLVRNANEGRLIVEYLNNYRKGLPIDYPWSFDVLSAESVFLKNNNAVAFIVSLIHYMVYPADQVNSGLLANLYAEINQINDNITFNPVELIPSAKIDKLKEWYILPVDELVETVITEFELNNELANLPFLQAFCDFVIHYTSRNTSTLANFLEHWNDNKHRLSVDVSDDQDAMRVLTIHKSKGLEFKNVIIPFCNWELDHNRYIPHYLWCSSNESPFDELEYIPVRYSAVLKETLFAHMYEQEMLMAFMDNFNLLYVAFTRASENLMVYSILPEDTNKVESMGSLLFTSFNAGIVSPENGFPALAFDKYWNPEDQCFTLGEIKMISTHKETESIDVPLSQFPVRPIKEKVKQHFATDNILPEATLEQLKIRVQGNIMHRIFQEIKHKDDISLAIDKVLLEGLIKPSDKESLTLVVEAMLSYQPIKDWYEGGWDVRNEAAIIVPGTHQYRPDRIMVKDNKAVIVDYKFGQIKETKYAGQVRKYVSLVEQMGYSDVQGYIWYVNMDELEKVN